MRRGHRGLSPPHTPGGPSSLNATADKRAVSGERLGFCTANIITKISEAPLETVGTLAVFSRPEVGSFLASE